MSEFDVKLTPSEMMVAIMSGGMRSIENIKQGSDHKYGMEAKQTWNLGIEGCLGEMALAKWKNLYWPGKGKLRDFDVDEFEVRTSWEHTHRLIVHKEDPPDRPVWFVTGHLGEYRIQGWIFAFEGQKEEFWTDPQPERFNYFIPSHYLRSPHETVESAKAKLQEAQEAEGTAIRR